MEYHEYHEIIMVDPSHTARSAMMPASTGLSTPCVSTVSAVDLPALDARAVVFASLDIVRTESREEVSMLPG